jgi:hypothetical protein
VSHETLRRCAQQLVKGFNACLVNYVDEDLIVAIADNMEVIGFRSALQFAEFFRTSKQDK